MPPAPVLPMKARRLADLRVAFVVFCLVVACPKQAFAQAAYCVPATQCTQGKYPNGWITSVQFNTINNASGCNGYTLYTEQPGRTAVFEQGQSYTLTVDVEGTSRNAWNNILRTLHYAKIFIDYNADGDFTDPNEMIFLGTDTERIDEVITIPGNASPGKTRMRIRSVVSDLGADGMNACNGAGLETEDYTITIAQASTAPPSCPDIFTPANNATGVIQNPTFTWSGASGGRATSFDLYFGADPASLTLIKQGITGNGYTAAYQWPSVLNPSTTYYYKVVPKNTYGEHTGCAVQRFTTAATNATVDYCEPATACVNNAILSVALNTLAVTSSCGDVRTGYTLYAPTGTKTTTLVKGQSYTLTAKTISESVYNNNAAVWFDFNHNGNLEETEFFPLLWQSLSTIAATVTIPADAVTGLTRMRVKLKASGGDGSWGPIQPGDACNGLGYYEARGETEDYDVTVAALPACTGLLPAYTKTDNTNCAGNANGSITITTNGGLAPYSIQWNDPAVSGFTPTNLKAGTYMATVTDAAGCGFSMNPIYILEPPPLQVAALETTNRNCAAGTGGTITVTPMGGTAPYRYAWDQPGITGSKPSHLADGVYTVTITDARGCSIQPPPFAIAPLSATYTPTHNQNCYFETVGAIDVTSTGGNPPFSYQWSGNPFDTPTSLYSAVTEDVHWLPTGTYSVKITDKTGCVTNVPDIRISAPPAKRLVAETVNVNCNENGESGMFRVRFANGELPFAVSVYSNGEQRYFYPYEGEDNWVICEHVPAGTYSVYAVDRQDCQTERLDVDIHETITPPATSLEQCSGSTATLSFTSMPAEVTLYWYADEAGTILLGTGPTFVTDVLTQPATYYVAAAENGCFGPRSPFHVNVSPGFDEPVISQSPGTVCEDGTVFLSTQDEGRALYHQWYKNGNPVPGANAAFYKAIQSGMYTVSRTNGYCDKMSAPVSVSVNVPPAAPTLTVGAEELTFSYYGDSFLLPVTSNTCWSVWASEPWLHSAKWQYAGNAGTLISADASAGNGMRTATLTITTGTITRMVRIIQTDYPPVLYTDYAGISMNASGETRAIKLTAEKAWTASPDQPWISVSPAAGAPLEQTVTDLLITVSPNTTGAIRTGKIKIQSGAASLYISVSQRRPLIAPEHLVFPANGGALTIQSYTSGSWTLSTPDPWLSVSTLSGSGNQTVTIHATANETENEKTGTIVFTHSTGTITINVRQQAAALTIDPGALEVLPQRGQAEIHVTTNVAWSATSVTQWLKPLNTEGNGNSVIMVSFDENTTVARREAVLVVQAGTITRYVTITQRGVAEILSVSTDTLRFNAAGETKAVTLQANVPWRVADKPTWLTLETRGSNGETAPAGLNCTAAANHAPESRQGTIWLEGGTLKRSIHVEQQGYVGTPQDITVLPNPATNVIVIAAEVTDPCLITLYTVGGVPVDTRTIYPGAHRIEFPVAHLARGIYIVNIATNRINRQIKVALR